MDLGLEGKRALVTGGSRGIGRRIVDLLAAEGCSVGFCARDQGHVDEAVATITRHGGKVIGRVVDVADDAHLRSWVGEMANDLGGIDIVVANASALAAGTDAASWRRGLDVDILGTVNLVEAAMPCLEASDAASIVGIASTAAINISRGIRSYGAVKAALINYLSSLSTNLAAKGIRANSVSPGAIIFEGGSWERRKTEEPEVYAAAVARCPMGRLGSPEEVANAVVFLASPAASYITGVNLVVDGAATTRVQF